MFLERLQHRDQRPGFAPDSLHRFLDKVEVSAWHTSRLFGRLGGLRPQAVQVGGPAQEHAPAGKRRAGEEFVRQLASPDFLALAAGPQHHQAAVFTQDDQPVPHDAGRGLAPPCPGSSPRFFLPSPASKHFTIPMLVTVKTRSAAGGRADDVGDILARWSRRRASW